MTLCVWFSEKKYARACRETACLAEDVNETMLIVMRLRTYADSGGIKGEGVVPHFQNSNSTTLMGVVMFMNSAVVYLIFEVIYLNIINWNKLIIKHEVYLFN